MLKREDIKPGDRLVFRRGDKVVEVTAGEILGDYGFNSNIGPIPWENLSFLGRATPETFDVTAAVAEYDKVMASADDITGIEVAPAAKPSPKTKAQPKAETKTPVKAEPARPKTRSEDIADEIVGLLRARNPLLWIVSREEGRTESYLAQAAAAAGFIPRMWDCDQGVSELDGTKADFGSADINDTLRVVRSRAEAESDRGAWILRDLPAWVSGPPGIVTNRQLRNMARFLPGVPRKGAQALIVLSPSGDVPPELANHATVIEWPMPDRAEIGKLLDNSINGLPEYEDKVDPETGKKLFDEKGAPIPDKTKPMRSLAAPNGVRDAAIDAAVGLSGEEAQACFAKSLVQTRRIEPASIAKEKKRVIARERVLEWFDPLPGGLDAVGGLENLKAWLVERKLAYSLKAREYGLPAPKGAFLAGVPGCGKSLTAKAIATAWGVPLLKFDLGALKGKFVGESEANMRKATNTIEAIGRCVVWIDEIEKGLAGATQGGADGGVSSDQLGTLLQWMQERKGESFVIATANDISALPPELMRAGRFDKVWFVDLPNRVERLEILRAALKAHGRSIADLKAERLTEVVTATNDFTGSEIAAIVPNALFSAFADEARAITVDDLIAAAKKVTPLATTASEKIKTLRDWSKGRASPATAEETVVDMPKARAASGGRVLDI